MCAWHVYLIRCHNGSLYAGISLDPQRRLAEHQCEGPKCAKYLRGKGPLELVFSYPAVDRSMASKFEYRLKRLPRHTKQGLINGDIDPDQVLGNIQEAD